MLKKAQPAPLIDVRPISRAMSMRSVTRALSDLKLASMNIKRSLVIDLEIAPLGPHPI
ncbi:hypothetical protein L288_18120 [Sphingobium quisquiliarum P25]|uniref:Uncharacterized protein n=1 Tax=Sphingobium quisquiliarum P25 TaxID=1329909 RepID=T0HMU0_9SPHN|nr:hypothetical protein L288_18120 [Sphingobium quisquiliarum P25]